MDTDWQKKLGKIIAVASGKGGVGKSTVAVNLACSLHKLGFKVGLLDADIYGPSQHIMMGLLNRNPIIDDNKKILPIMQHGLAVMSFGFFVKPDQAVIWRGPMIARMFQQFLQDVLWEELDYLIVDLPPGTGDIQLSLSQLLRVHGVVVVTTPQEIALADAIKGIHMFRKVEVEIIGLVENMSVFVCPHCQKPSEIFSSAGGLREAKRLNVPYLGEIPLEPKTREYCDAGFPISLAEPDSDQAQRFLKVANQVHANVTDLLSRRPELNQPKEDDQHRDKPFAV